MAKKQGGKRPGAGRPKGSLNPSTQVKAVARERFRELVVADLDPIIKAQIEHAKGVSYMVLRNPDGTFTRATDATQIDAACATGATTFRIFTQAPNTQAFVALTNQALDKAVEHHAHSGDEGGPIVVKWKD